jgi:hypothetical protein
MTAPISTRRRMIPSTKEQRENALLALLAFGCVAGIIVIGRL